MATGEGQFYADFTRWKREVERRLTAVERRAKIALDPTVIEFTFNLNGRLTVSESDDCPIARACALYELELRLKTPDSAASVIVALKRNGTVVNSVTIPMGTSRLVVALAAPLGRGSHLTTAVTNAGTDAAGLVSVARARTPT